jgi:hypothetical protein
MLRGVMSEVVEQTVGAEVFAPWSAAQRVAEGLALEPLMDPAALRRGPGLLAREEAVRIAAWFAGPSYAPAQAIGDAYDALERETRALHAEIRSALGVRVRYTHGAADPYDNAAALCADLRTNRTMMLRTAALDTPHPRLDSSRDGTLDRLRIVHDVLGHAALGLGFDVQSEYATWLQCRLLFSPRARAAAFTELVGAVTTYVATGTKPPLRADLPPEDLLA